MAPGDFVEAVVERGRIVLKPNSLIDRLRAETYIPPALQAKRQAARRAGLDKMSMRAIDAETAAARPKRRGK